MLVEFRTDEIEEFKKYEWVNVRGGGSFKIITELKDIEFKEDIYSALKRKMVRRRSQENPEE